MLVCRYPSIYTNNCLNMLGWHYYIITITLNQVRLFQISKQNCRIFFPFSRYYIFSVHKMDHFGYLFERVIFVRVLHFEICCKEYSYVNYQELQENCCIRDLIFQKYCHNFFIFNVFLV